MSTGVFLARHGQTAYNQEGRFPGQLPVPLDDTGRAQAALRALIIWRGKGNACCCLIRRRFHETNYVATRFAAAPKFT